MSTARILAPAAAVALRCARLSAAIGFAPTAEELDMTSTASTTRADSLNSRMESIEIAGTSLVVSRIGLGTWAIGGWMWGGTDEAESMRTIHAALDRGVTVFDTAPVYGFGRSR